MSTYQEFENKTLPQLIKVINAQSTEINMLIGEVALLYTLFGLIGIYIIYWVVKKILKKYLKFEIKRVKGTAKIVLLLVMICSMAIPLSSAKTLDSSKRIDANSTYGVIGFISDLSFTSIENNKTTGMTKITDANMSNYTWVNIGFSVNNSSNTIIIVGLKSTYINYTSSMINGIQKVLVSSKPSVVIGGIFSWDNINKIVSIINSASDVIIKWTTSTATIALPILVFGLVTSLSICLWIATRKRDRKRW